MVANTVSALGLIISAALKDHQTVITIAPIFIIIAQMFAGFLISFDQLPVWLAWLKYPSFFKYGYQALMLVSKSFN